MDFRNSAELMEKWIELCEERHSTKSKNRTTIGVEIEFFLLNSSSKPVNLIESQSFFKALKAKLESCKQDVKHETEELDGFSCISKVKYPNSNNAWTYICYEYPPHLFEISFAYHDNLNDLSKEIDEVLEVLKFVAAENRLHASFKPKLNSKEINQMHALDNSLQRVLRESRIAMLLNGPHAKETHLADFPSYLAATHIHVGGYRWWQNGEFVNNLYRLEPFLMFEAKGIDFKERWDHYHKVFHEFSLVGFPKVTKWTLHWWINELFNSSYQMQKNRITTSLGLNKLRDLQVIRPRAIGTIEFRSDSAQSDTRSVMHLAALRLGQYLLAQSELPKWLPSYSDAQKNWQEQMEASAILDEEKQIEVLDLIFQTLLKRGNGEEKFIVHHKIQTSKTA